MRVQQCTYCFLYQKYDKTFLWRNRGNIWTVLDVTTAVFSKPVLIQLDVANFGILWPPRRMKSSVSESFSGIRKEKFQCTRRKADSPVVALESNFLNVHRNRVYLAIVHTQSFECPLAKCWLLWARVPSSCERPRRKVFTAGQIKRFPSVGRK